MERMPCSLNRRELNVLRQLFNRAQVTPGEVAALGYSALARAPGLGAKGLAHVLDWLRAAGVEPHPPTKTVLRKNRSAPSAAGCRRAQLDQARRLLEANGYAVMSRDDAD